MRVANPGLVSLRQIAFGKTAAPAAAALDNPIYSFFELSDCAHFFLLSLRHTVGFDSKNKNSRQEDRSALHNFMESQCKRVGDTEGMRNSSWGTEL
jgi:hypothetical protein